MRLIDMNALPRSTWLDGNTLVMAVRELDEAPTVDAVEVTRCKDCIMAQKLSEEGKLFRNHAIMCTLNGCTWLRDDFCSYGVKAEED